MSEHENQESDGPYASPKEGDAIENWQCATRKRRRRYWFLSGFVPVFLGMLFFASMYPMHPSGQYVFKCKLWEYYLIELRTFNLGVETLGPTSGHTSAALLVALEHLVLSTIAGLLMMGLGWGVYRIRHAKRRELN